MPINEKNSKSEFLNPKQKPKNKIQTLAGLTSLGYSNLGFV